MNIDEMMYQRMLAKQGISRSSSKNSSSSSKKSSSSSEKSSSTSKREEAARRQASVARSLALREAASKQQLTKKMAAEKAKRNAEAAKRKVYTTPVSGTHGAEAQKHVVTKAISDEYKKRQAATAKRKEAMRKSTVPISGSQQRQKTSPALTKEYHKRVEATKERKKKILQASNSVNLGTDEHPMFVTGRPDLVAEYFRRVGNTAKRREALGLEVRGLPGSFSEYAPADLDDFASGFQQQYEARKAAQEQKKTPDVRAAGTGTFNSGGAPGRASSRAPYTQPQQYSGTAGATRTPVTGRGGGGPQYGGGGGGGGGGGQYNPMSSMLRGTAQNTLPNMARGNTGPAMPAQVPTPRPQQQRPAGNTFQPPFPTNRRY